MRAATDPDDVIVRTDARCALARALVHRKIESACDAERVRDLRRWRSCRLELSRAFMRAMVDCCPRLTLSRILSHFDAHERP